MSAILAGPRFHLSPRTRAAIGFCFLALLVHLIPVFLPRKVPSVELDLARLVPDAQHRIELLLPLLQNPRSTAANLRDAAELVLPASSTTARRFLAAAERRAPSSEENELLRARICRADGDTPCVSRALASARAAAPADPQPDLMEADFAELSGHPAQAVAALGRAHGKAPEDVALGLRYAHALASSGRWPDAERVFRQVAKALPPARARLEHGLLLLDAGERQEAREEFAEAVRQDPNDAEAHYDLAVSLYHEEAWGAAERELRIADQLNPKDFRALALLCALQRENARIDEAAATRVMLDRRFAAQRSQYEDACPP